jgi:hypothetical protein
MQDFPSCFSDVVHGPAIDVGAHHPHHYGVKQIKEI